MIDGNLIDGDGFFGSSTSSFSDGKSTTLR
jgi:hypothetical protein